MTLCRGRHCVRNERTYVIDILHLKEEYVDSVIILIMLLEAYSLSRDHNLVLLTLAEQDYHMVWGLAAILAISMWPVPRNRFLLWRHFRVAKPECNSPLLLNKCRAASILSGLVECSAYSEHTPTQCWGSVPGYMGTHHLVLCLGKVLVTPASTRCLWEHRGGAGLSALVSPSCHHWHNMPSNTMSHSKKYSFGIVVFKVKVWKDK